MTNEQALAILKQPDRIGCNLIKANDEESNKYNQESIEALDMAIKALEQSTSDDCVSRQAVLETIDDCNSDGLKGIFCSYDDGERFREYIRKLPPVTPTHGTCKDCKHRDPEDKMCDSGHSIQWQLPRPNDWHCADFEK